MLYSYSICKGHLVAEIESFYFLIDTGCNCSFGMNGLNRVTINGKKFSLKPIFMLDKITPEDLEKFVGHTLDGIIGQDIIYSFNGLTFLRNDYDGVTGNKMEFDNFHFTRSKTEKKHVLINMTVTDVTINGGNIGPAFLDTGAHLPMVASSIFTVMGAHSMSYSAYGKTLAPVNELTLGYGWQTTERKTIDIALGSAHFYEALVMTPSIERACQGYKCFLGITELFEDYFCFDFQNKQVHYN